MIDAIAPDYAGLPVLGPQQADISLRERVRGEFREMPGLRLTLAQASRLFGLDAPRCSAVLHALVTDGALWTNGREFLSIGVGRRSA